MTKDSRLCSGSADFGAVNIGGVENRPHRLLGSGEDLTELSPGALTGS